MIPLLAGAQLIERCVEETAALVYGGALVDNSLQDVLELYRKPPVVIVNDPTRLFISPEIYNRYTGQGGVIEVLQKLIFLRLLLTQPTLAAGVMIRKCF
jgi:hypothetical protein